MLGKIFELAIDALKIYAGAQVSKTPIDKRELVRFINNEFSMKDRLWLVRNTTSKWETSLRLGHGQIDFTYVDLTRLREAEGVHSGRMEIPSDLEREERAAITGRLHVEYNANGVPVYSDLFSDGPVKGISGCLRDLKLKRLVDYGEITDEDFNQLLAYYFDEGSETYNKWKK